MSKKLKLPTLKDLAALVRHVKAQIGDEYRAFEDDEMPGIQLTVGADDAGNWWSYQTGDNIYSGGAYGFPYRGVVVVYRRSNSRDVARDLQSQIAEAQW